MAREQEPSTAVRTDAAAKAALGQMGAALAPAMRALYDAELEPVRRVLGQQAAADALAEGHALTLEHVLAAALAWLARPPVARACGDPPDDAHGEPDARIAASGLG